MWPEEKISTSGEQRQKIRELFDKNLSEETPFKLKLDHKFTKKYI